jgi:hypothetical protein
VDLEAGAERLHAVLRAGVGGESDRRHERALLRRQAPDAAHELVAVLVGHLDVGDDHVEMLSPKRLVRLRGRAGDRRLSPAPHDHGGDELPGVRLVVDDQDAQVFQGGRRLEPHRSLGGGMALGGARGLGGDASPRQSDLEDRSGPVLAIRGLDRPPVKLDHVAHDRQP